MHTSGSVLREGEDVRGGKGEGGREEAKREAIDSERALREEEKGACIFSCTNHETCDSVVGSLFICSRFPVSHPEGCDSAVGSVFGKCFSTKFPHAMCMYVCSRFRVSHPGLIRGTPRQCTGTNCELYAFIITGILVSLAISVSLSLSLSLSLPIPTETGSGTYAQKCPQNQSPKNHRYFSSSLPEEKTKFYTRDTKECTNGNKQR